MHDYRDDVHPADQKEDAEDETCPICIEPFDTEDQRFIACPCNYRVCMFCVRRIRTEFDGRCPGCRRDYKEENFRFLNLEDRFTRGRKSAHVRISNGSDNAGTNSYHNSNSRGQRNSDKYHRRTGSNSGTNAASGKYDYSEDGFGYGENGDDGTQAARVNMKDLANVRVVQDNLVYLIGLAPSIAREETLRSNRFFGQYGRIIKVVVSRNSNSDRNSNHNRSPSSSAYITFSRPDDAKAAIQAVNGFWIDNHMIRASYGTTKYCNMFLRHLPCNNPDCLYLHKLGDESSSFTKEQMQQAGRSQFQEAPQTVMEPPGLDGRDENTCLPTRGLTVSDFLQNSKPESGQASTGNRPAESPLKLNGNSINAAASGPSRTTVGSGVGRGTTNVWGNKSRVSSLASGSAAVGGGATGWSSASTAVLRSSESSPEQEQSKSRSQANTALDEPLHKLSRSKSAHSSLQANGIQQVQRQGRSNIVYDSLSQESKEPVKRLASEEQALNPRTQSLLSTLGGIELSAYNKQHQVPENRKLRTISPIGHPIHTEPQRFEDGDLSKSFHQDPRLYGVKGAKSTPDDEWLQAGSGMARLGGESSTMDFNMSSLLRPVEVHPQAEDRFGISRPQAQRKGRLWEGSVVNGKPNDSYADIHAHTSTSMRDGQVLPDMGRAHGVQQQQPKFHILSNVHRGKGVQQKATQGAHFAQNSHNRYTNPHNSFVERGTTSRPENSSLLAGHSFNLQKN